MAVSSKKQLSLFKDKQKTKQPTNVSQTKQFHVGGGSVGEVGGGGVAKEEGIRQWIKGLNTVTKHQPTYFTIVGVPVHEAGIMTRVPGRHFAITGGDEESAVSRILQTCEGCFL